MITGVDVEGGMKFIIEARISGAELATWEPNRMRAFFEGLTQVILAQRGKEAIEGWKKDRAEIDAQIRRLEDAIDQAGAIADADPGVEAGHREAAPSSSVPSIP